MMKKTVNYAMIYAILAMIGGVFYREFTKFQGFSGRTDLAFVHTHLFLLGMVMFLIVTFCIKLFAIDESKKYKLFLRIYHPGVLIMLFVRGILQVNQTVVSSGMNGMISGIAGVGHILTGVGIILFLLILKECVKEA